MQDQTTTLSYGNVPKNEGRWCIEVSYFFKKNSTERLPLPATSAGLFAHLELEEAQYTFALYFCKLLRIKQMQKYKEAIIWIVHEISGSDIGEYLQLENINVQKEKISHLEVL